MPLDPELLGRSGATQAAGPRGRPGPHFPGRHFGSLFTSRRALPGNMAVTAGDDSGPARALGGPRRCRTYHLVVVVAVGNVGFLEKRAQGGLRTNTAAGRRLTGTGQEAYRRPGPRTGSSARCCAPGPRRAPRRPRGRGSSTGAVNSAPPASPPHGSPGRRRAHSGPHAPRTASGPPVAAALPGRPRSPRPARTG